MHPAAVPYVYKFLKDINFAVFAVNFSSTKFKCLKFYKTIVIHENKIAKILDLGYPRNLHPQ